MKRFRGGHLGHVRILRRPKVSGLGTHDGLQLPDGTVVDITSDAGVQHRSFEEFAHGLQVAEVRKVNPVLYPRVMSNVRMALLAQRPYHPTDWNCERFVNWLTCEQPESPSVSGWFFVAVAVAAVALVARA